MVVLYCCNPDEGGRWSSKIIPSHRERSTRTVTPNFLLAVVLVGTDSKLLEGDKETRISEYSLSEKMSWRAIHTGIPVLPVPVRHKSFTNNLISQQRPRFLKMPKYFHVECFSISDLSFFCDARGSRLPASQKSEVTAYKAKKEKAHPRLHKTITMAESTVRSGNSLALP